jgi:hypothetical protein
MAKIETQVERDANGRVVGYSETIERPRNGGGFGWGVLLGGLIIAAAIVGFGYSQGSFQNAGRDADRATAQAEQQIGSTAERAGDLAENAGDRVNSELN